MLYRVYIFMFLWSIGIVANCQTIDGYNYSYYNFSKTDGIPEVNVFSIVQDHQGFIYTGAGSGLYVHYGHKWQHLVSPIDNEDNNIGSYLHELVFDPAKKMLYLGSQTDLQCYDTKTGEFTRVKTRVGFHDAQKYTFFYHKATGVLVPTTEGIFQIYKDTLLPYKPTLNWPKNVDKSCRFIEAIDHERIVLFFVGQIGIYDTSKDQLDLFHHPNGGSLGKGVYDKERNKIWFQSYQKIYFFDLNSMKYGIMPGSENNFECRNIILKDNHQLWISSSSFFDLNKNKWTYIPYSEGKYSNAIMYWPRFLLDKENNLWTSSQGFNLNVLFDKNKAVRVSPLIYKGIGLGPNSFLMVNGRLYVVADNVLCEYDPKNYTTKYHEISSEPYHFNLTYDNDHTFYMISSQNIYAFDINTHAVKKIYEAAGHLDKIGSLGYLVYFENQLLFGGSKGLVIMDIDGKNESFKPILINDKGTFSSAYYYNTNRNIYLVFSKEILVYDNKSKMISSLETHEGSLNMKNKYMMVGDGNHLYISSTTDGLYQYNMQTKNIRLFNKSNSLLETNFTSFLSKDGDNIWVASMLGTYLYNTKNECFTTKLDRQNGFKYDHATYGMIADKNFVIQLTFGQIGVLDKKALVKTNEVPLYIYGINIENHEKLPVPIYHDTAFALNENESIIDISYGIPYFTNFNHNHFQYRIIGFDTTWKSTFSTSLRLPKLDIGTYTLEIKAWKSNGEQVDDIRQITFIINPHFYKTWWFGLGVLVLFSSFIYALYRLKLDKIKTELILTNKYEKQIAEIEMKALRAQMNPHFIFNSLNSIQKFILQKDEYTASQYLTKFSRLIRLILDQSNQEYITLNSELEMIKLYTEMEAIRFHDKFEFHVYIDPQLTTEVKLPSMIIQPHIENAIWHGLLHKKEKGLIQLSIIKISEKLLEITIEDNGIGRVKAQELKSKQVLKNKSYGSKISADRQHLFNQANNINAPIKYQDLINAEGKPIGTKVIIPLAIYI